MNERNSDNEKLTDEEKERRRRMTTSDAPNASFEEGAGPDQTGFDSPPIGSISLSNVELEALDPLHDEPSTSGDTAERREPPVTDNDRDRSDEEKEKG